MTIFKSHSLQTIVEEIVNAVTHGIGVILSLVALTLMLVYAAIDGSSYKIWSAALFGGSLLLMYLASTLYHAVQQPKLKKILKIVDHAAIYLLIAGSYTPFLLCTLHNHLGWVIFFIVWILAVSGVVYKLFFVYHFPKLSVAIYLIMGWLSLFLVKPLAQHLSQHGIVWLISGGVSYSVGVVFYVWKRLYFSHALWHLFVLGGSTCHFFAVFLYVI